MHFGNSLLHIFLYAALARSSSRFTLISTNYYSRIKKRWSFSHVPNKSKALTPKRLRLSSFVHREAQPNKSPLMLQQSNYRRTLRQISNHCVLSTVQLDTNRYVRSCHRRNGFRVYQFDLSVPDRIPFYAFLQEFWCIHCGQLKDAETYKHLRNIIQTVVHIEVVKDPLQ